MSLKKNIKDLKKDLEKIKEEKNRKKNVEEVFKKFEAVRREHGYKSEYDCLVELGVIEDIVVPPDTVDLLDVMKQKHMLVKKAMSDQKVQEQVRTMQRNFKEACKQEGYLK